MRQGCCFFHEVRYPPEQLTPAWNLVLPLDSSLKQKLISFSFSFFPSNPHARFPYLCLFLLHIMNPAAPKFPGMIIEKNISTRRAVQDNNQYFESIFLSFIQNTMIFQKSSSVGVKTFQHGPSSPQSSYCHPFTVIS